MLWNMWSITRQKRSYGHPMHPDLTPDVLTCVLPLGKVSSGRESEVESAHLYLTIIQFFSACHLTSQHTSTCIHNSIILHSPTHSQEGKRSQGGQKKRYKDTLKASLKDFNIPTESWEQSGVASSTKVPPNLKQRESVKLKGSVKKGKQESRDHHQTRHSPNSLALFATDSLELKLAYTTINEHTTTHKRLIFRIKMVFLSNERRTIRGFPVISYQGHFVPRTFQTILVISHPLFIFIWAISYPVLSFRTQFGHFVPIFISLFKIILVISYLVFTFSYPSHLKNVVLFYTQVFLSQ